MAEFIYPDARLIAGVDEVGRGPLVGAVVTAAVILDPARPIAGLADSKKLSEKRRLALFDEIKEKALAWSLGRAEPEEIDQLISRTRLSPFTTACDGIGSAGQRLPSIRTKSGAICRPATARCIASMVACRMFS